MERGADGGQTDFGKITLWDPPSQLDYDFYMGSSKVEPTSVSIRFTPREDGTKVVIEHTRGALPEEKWQRTNAGFDDAWTDVVALYQQHVED